jgi:hypothetical protein
MKKRYHVSACTPSKIRGGSNVACIAVVFILIIGAVGGYIYLQQQGFSLAGSSVNSVKNTTASQKKDYLKLLKKESRSLNTVSSSLDELIKGVRSGSFKTQVDINTRAADVENRMATSLSKLQKMKVPCEFAEGHKEIMTSFKSYSDCLSKVRRINNVLAGNMDQIDQNLQEISTIYQKGNQQISTGMGMIRKKQGELRLGTII